MNNTIKAAMFNKNDWYKKWFDTSFYRKLYAHRNDQEAARFIDELITHLQPSPLTHMLDLGCGNGRHSKYLFSKGFDVTGIDLAASSIREAKKWETDRLRFRQLNMLLPFGSNEFEYVFSFFTSFGYFESSSDDQRVCNNIYHAVETRRTTGDGLHKCYEC